jgi:predicted RNA-binding protein with EMAP domain
MGRQIVKQPDGKYCIFSSIVDNVTYYNMTPEDIIEAWSRESKKQITKKVNKIVEQLDKGEEPYHQFAMDYEDMLKDIGIVHGKKEMKKIKSTIESK